MKFKDLRKKYPRFIYEKFSWRIINNNLKIFFNFKIEPDISFRPEITIKNIKKTQIAKIGNRILNPLRSCKFLNEVNNLIFHLGLIEMISYWKATCSPEIIIKTGPLNREQIKWWKGLIINGMGQFFYENKIDFTQSNFLKIKSLQRSNLCQSGRSPTSAQILIPIGGGKDSTVTLELLKKAGKSIQCFSLNPTKAAQKIMKMAGFKNPIIVRRKIDEKLLKLNKKGYLNGHTPFSAYLAFLSILVVAIFGQKLIVFSNERSSNEGNVKYLGKIINHQWSKSFEFEKKFRSYFKKYLAPRQKSGGGLEYFSFLRPLYEIQIAKLFSKYPKYFLVFLSCNTAYQTASGTKKPNKKWCGNCPKCLFVFATLYPFIDEGTLIKIFGRNVFDNKNLLPVMLQLVGGGKFKSCSENLTKFSERKSNVAKQIKFLLRGKPFECVGTKKESRVAFYLSWREAKRVGDLPFLLKCFKEMVLPKYPDLEKESKRILSAWNNQHNLPKEFKKILKNTIS